MRILVTGGLGFIGSNIANRYLSEGHEVTVLDNLSRTGTNFNLNWLKENHKKGLEFLNVDVRDADKVRSAVRDKDAIFHTAAQVTVTDSVTNPRNDAEINILGTFNVMEAARLANTNPFVLYTSTNKVYGEGINTIPLEQSETRWRFADSMFTNGIPESFSTDFDEHSPYGVSKYCADLYVRDYSNVYGIHGVSFRQSCIYGTRQFGREEQGWLAHFIISSVFRRPINIFGDGKQVRDTLFIDDLLDAMDLALRNKEKVKGKAYNIGGGPKNTLSLIELISLLEKMNGSKIETRYFDWRPADQKVYISDISKAKKDFGWEPKISPEEGVRRLNDWVKSNIKLFK
jgi:CDP-paratose 2-epimerase